MITAAAAVILGTAACTDDPAAGPTLGGEGTLDTADSTTPAPPPATTAGPASQPGPPAPAPGAEDCFTYDPQVLVSRYEAGVHVVFPDHGPEILRVHGGPGDVVGDKAIEVAKLFSTVCYIGRFNSFGSPEFVYEYWTDPSGSPASPLLFAGGDCTSYAPPDLAVEALAGGAGFRVTAGGADLQHFATEADANLGRNKIGLQDLLCRVEDSTPEGEPSDITYTFNSGD